MISSQGIYTLANDAVYDQLVALLNSIERNISPEIPVYVIPYNNSMERVIEEISLREQVKLFDNYQSLARWDNFFNEVWKCHPRAKNPLLRPSWYKGFVHRKFASFDGPLEKFAFFDADSLAMKSLNGLFEKLNSFDLVFDDWEHSKNRFLTEIDLEAIEAATGLTQAEILLKIHCDSFFGGKQGLFPPEELDMLKDNLIKGKEVQWVKDDCWWSSSALFNCMTLRTNYTMFNFTLSPDSQDRTGNCADADIFVEIDGVLYNQDGCKPIHRIHYMNYPSAKFTRLCKGENSDVCYKDIFLNYRFLKNPDRKPKYFKNPSLFSYFAHEIQKTIKKIRRVILG